MDKKEADRKNGKTECVRVKVTKQLKKLLAEKAEEENRSMNDLSNSALTLYLTKDVTTDGLLMARMGEILRQLDFIDKKVELQGKLYLFWIQNYYMQTPDLPKDREEVRRLIMRSEDLTTKFLKRFKNKLSQTPSYMESLLGGMLEEDADND